MKKFLFLIIILLLLSNISLASEQINMKEFLAEIKNYSDEIFPEISDENWISEVIGRSNEFGWSKYF
ncbi:MAG: hypothetical protein IJ220_06465 [Clostridia bacterium]|nr:hypothetical protein [Clostridia bacterium]